VRRRGAALRRDSTVVRTVLWPTGRQLQARLPRLVVGLTIISLGIALSARSGAGLAPYEVFHQGLAVHTPLTLGRASIVTGVVVLLLWIPLRMAPGLGTILNIVGVGFATDAFLAIVDEPQGLLLRGVFTVVGVGLVGVGIGLYIGAGLGPGPRDGLMTGLAARGWPVWGVRLVLELSALLSGWLLGGTVGVGTVLFATAVPFLAHASLSLLSVPDDEDDVAVGAVPAALPEGGR
jgi:uncharacterized membrane protein YczE